jgi:mycothiol synthase
VNLRPASSEDLDAIVELFDAGRTMYEEPFGSAEELRQWLTSPRIELARDVRLGFERGRLVGYVDVDPLAEDPVRWWSDVRVHPACDAESVASELLRWAEGRAGEGILRTWAPSGLTALRRVYERHGMRRVRGSYRMEIGLEDDLPPPAFPPGIAVRTLAPGDEPVAYEVHEESFEDSWEHTRESFEEWRHYLVETESFDPTLWFLAWDGDSPAGVAICRLREGIGWVGVLGVRRNWRRRGLGRALLLHSLHEFRRRGVRRAGLGVDAESLTGAHKLYESVGMEVARELGIYEKVLP